MIVSYINIKLFKKGRPKKLHFFKFAIKMPIFIFWKFFRPFMSKLRVCRSKINLILSDWTIFAILRMYADQRLWTEGAHEICNDRHFRISRFYLIQWPSFLLSVTNTVERPYSFTMTVIVSFGHKLNFLKIFIK